MRSECLPKFISDDIGRAVFNRRMELDVSQIEVAKAARIDQGSMSRIERTSNDLRSKRVLDKLSYALGVDIYEYAHGDVTSIAYESSQNSLNVENAQEENDELLELRLENQQLRIELLSVRSELQLMRSTEQ